jgi:Replication-relaxation
MEAAVMTSTERMTWRAVERIADGLSDRDRAILRDVARLRVLTSRQLGRLHFADLQGAHRDRTRRRVLERLTSLSVLTSLNRRIGGTRAGSAGLVFALGLAGQRLAAITHDRDDAPHTRTRQPHTPTARFLGHELAVSELYVRLVELARTGSLTLVAFRAEPVSWWQDDAGAWIKPDAYVIVSAGDIEDAWAIEVDMATESLPTLRRKLVTYFDLAGRGDEGPDGRGLPRVLITVPDERRERAVRELLRDLSPPADQLFAVTVHDGAAAFIATVLRE